MDNGQPKIDSTDYPARLKIDYSEKLSRLSTFLRVLYAIPITLVLFLLSGIYIDIAGSMVSGQGFLFLAPMAMILFRKKYPRWWFDWNLEFSRFNMRLASYIFLLSDEYPSTDEQQAVHLDLDPPDAQNLNRFLPLVKWVLAIPHFIMIIVLSFVAFFSLIFAWCAILLTGKYPRPLFNFIVGFFRWGLRVQAYCILLITDKYPPFSLK